MISGAVGSALVIVPQAALSSATDSSRLVAATVFSTLDQIIIILALLVVVWTGIFWGRRRRRDPLSNAPLRPNHLREDSILLAVCVYLLAAVVISGVVGLFVADPNEARARLIAGNGAHLCGIVACLLIADRRFEGGWFRFAFGYPPARLGRRVALVFFASILAIGLCPLIGEATVRAILHFWPSYQFDPHPTIKALHDGLQPRWAVVGLWIGAVAVAPIAEEFFFRGLLQTFLAGIARNRWLAIGLTAIVFGIVHLSQPHTIVALTAFGVLLGYAYERTGSLVPSIMIHAVFNLKTLIWDAFAVITS